MPAKKRAAAAKAPSKVMETRVFKAGNSYAVRLPKPLYMGGEAAVYVTKLDDGALLIAPKRKRRWPAAFFESFGKLPADFEAPERPKASRAEDARDARMFDEIE